MNKRLKIGLVGFGCVGSGLYEVLQKSNIIDAEIKRIVVKDKSKKRSIEESWFSYDINDIILDDEINVVVELINDSDVAYDIVKRALVSGKDVVTANKKLIAEKLDELIILANENNVSLLYEGAVAGSIPIIRNLEEYYNNDSLTSVQGIVNGTTNYILTKSNEGQGYAESLVEATELGFAELDPTLDVDGYDSKYKLVLLLKHAFGVTVQPEEVLNIGIRRITEREVAYANEKGLRIKLFSRAEKLGDKVIGFVAPQLIREDHFAYNVNNEFNAVVVEALFSDKQLFIGKGAGSYPTASAVLSDVSALKFDYKYEYRKTVVNKQSEYSTDFFIRVYIGSKYVEAINEIPFYRVDELFQSEDYSYQTGWVKFSDLVGRNFNGRDDISILVLPDEVRQSDEFINEGVERKLVALETV
jgi:homoserine dehydrogenase